jgi:hypothetical protein
VSKETYYSVKRDLHLFLSKDTGDFSLLVCGGAVVWGSHAGAIHTHTHTHTHRHRERHTHTPEPIHTDTDTHLSHIRCEFGRRGTLPVWNTP